MPAGTVKGGRRKPRRVNPAAKALRTPAYRPRTVKSKKTYRRKVRTADDGPDAGGA
jgi:hypothetical protein